MRIINMGSIIVGSSMVIFTVLSNPAPHEIWFWWFVGTVGLIMALCGVADLASELAVKKM
jgi:hypothetical protein